MDTTNVDAIWEASQGIAALPVSTDIRALIVQFMRGRFITPVLAKLGEYGVLDRLVEQPIHVSDYPQFNPKVLRSLLTYLEALGLITPARPAGWQATALGRKVFPRWGGFCILDSYDAYFTRLDELLLSQDIPIDICVDRTQNIIGTGQLHARKFFPAALDLLAGESPSVVVDIGCGDGAFLGAVLDRYPGATVVAIDLSAASIELAHTRLGSRLSTNWYSVVADGADVNAWGAAIPATTQRMIITGWFVLHEFCGGSVEKACAFLVAVREQFPNAEVIIGEVVRAEPDVLARGHARSILPEFQLFHALSGQGLFSWAQFGELRGDMPYRVQSERLIDPVETAAGEMVPANLIWHLVPK